MGVTITRRSNPKMVVTLEKTPNGTVKHIVVNGHLKHASAKEAVAKKVKQPVAEISLSQPGRVRVAQLSHLLGISRSTLYAGMNTDRYPKPDGKDGRIPYWNTETIRALLAKAPQCEKADF